MSDIQNFRQNLHVPSPYDMDLNPPGNWISVGGLKGRLFNLVITPIVFGRGVLTTADITVLIACRVTKTVFISGGFVASLTFDFFFSQRIDQMTKDIGAEAYSNMRSSALTCVILGMNLIKSIDTIAFTIFGVLLPSTGTFGRKTFTMPDWALRHIDIIPPQNPQPDGAPSSAKGGAQYRSGAGGTHGGAYNSGPGGPTEDTYTEQLKKNLSQIRKIEAEACTDERFGDRYKAAKARFLEAESLSKPEQQAAKILNLTSPAPHTKNEILSSFKKILPGIHPDKYQNLPKLKEEADIMVKVLNDARDKLIDAL